MRCCVGWGTTTPATYTYRYDGAFPSVIEALLRAGAEKNAATTALNGATSAPSGGGGGGGGGGGSGGGGETPAMLAVRCRQWDLAVLLSDDIDARYRDGRTALHHALTFQDAYTVHDAPFSAACSVFDDLFVVFIFV